MNNITLEELGWKLILEQSEITYLVYRRDDEYLYIDLERKKVEFATDNYISFATLEAIREIVINSAIY